MNIRLHVWFTHNGGLLRHFCGKFMLNVPAYLLMLEPGKMVNDDSA